MDTFTSDLGDSHQAGEHIRCGTVPTIEQERNQVLGLAREQPCTVTRMQSIPCRHGVSEMVVKSRFDGARRKPERSPGLTRSG